MKYRQTRQTGRASQPLVAALLALTIATSPAAADEAQMQRIVDSGALAKSPNSILLDYLLNDGKDALPPELHKQAVDQIVEALRTQTLVDPLEGMDQMMAAANPMNMFKGNKKGLMKSMGMGMLRSATGGGGGMSSGMNSQMQQMKKNMDSALIDPWVRGLGAAATLTQAGYTDDSARFYRGCLTSIGSIVPSGSKNDWLQDQCINGALLMGPNDAGALFAGLWEEPYMDYGFDFAAYGGQDAQMPAVPEIQAVAAHGLGKLVGSGQLSTQQRAGVMQVLIDMVRMKKPDLTALIGGVQGLSFAEDPQAVGPLQKMWKKGKPKEIRPVALGGLVAGYREPEAIKALRKDLKTGTGVIATYKKAKSFAPWTAETGQQGPLQGEEQGANDAEVRYMAARALMRAGDDAGYQFAAKFLDERNVPPGDWDYRPDLIRDLVETGGDRSRSVLDEMVTDGHQNEWLEAMMRTGLLELGDRSQIPELATLLDKRDWDFGRGTAARWYKRFKPLLWQGVKMAAKAYMGMPPDERDWQRIRQFVTNMAWAERDRMVARKTERDVKTDQFRWQLADSAGEVDDPQCLSLLAPLLGDEEASVRLSAASALLDQSAPGTADLLFRALTLDYGGEKSISRNPEIHAAVTRRLIRTFPTHPATKQALQRAAKSDSPSVQFLALAAQRDLARRSARSG